MKNVMKKDANASIRQVMRQKREALTNKEQSAASIAILEKFKTSASLSTAKNIALYYATAAEISTLPLIHYCWQQNKKVYLPVLHPFCKKHLVFLRFEKNTQLSINRFGIFEPSLNVQAVIPSEKLDLICAPLLAFDLNGNRLGMGGGYYDRLFARIEKNKRIGLAHDCQQLEKLGVNTWDMPLAEVITPSKHWFF